MELDDLHPRVVQPEGIGALMGGVKGLDQGVQIDMPCIDRDRYCVLLPVVAQFDPGRQVQRRRLAAAGEIGFCLRRHVVQDGLQIAAAGAVAVQWNRAHQIDARCSRQHAPGGEQAGIERNDEFLRAQFA